MFDMEKKRNSGYENKITPITVYLFCSLFGIFLFFTVAIFKRQELFDWIMMENNSDFAMLDYFRHIGYSQYFNILYTESGVDCNFPPLAYLFYYFMCRITTKGFIDNSMREISYLPYQIILYIMYLIVGVIWLAYVIEELGMSKTKKRLLLFSIIFSVPMFAGAIERGNMALYVIVILLTVVLWKDSEIRWKQEAALILIAVAAGLKVYPAVFGLIYIKEKRWREAGRLILYGICLFFIPFIFYGGGKGVLAYWHILSGQMAREFVGRIQFFKGLMGFIAIRGTSATILNMIFMCILLSGILFSKDKIREMTYLASFMAFIPANAYRYTLVYFLLIVFALFLEDKKITSIDDYVTAAILGNLFSIPTLWGVVTGFELNYGLYTYTYVEQYIYILAWGFLGYEMVRGFLDWRWVRKAES